MTFTEIKTEIKDRLNYTSTAADTRVGRAINRLYREIGTSIGMSFTRQVEKSEVVTIGNPLVTFSETEKLLQVWTLDDNARPTILHIVKLAELRESTTTDSDRARTYAIANVTSNSVTIRLDRAPETAYTIYADVVTEVSDLSGSDAPALPESFHDILIEGVLRDEYKKIEKENLAKISDATYLRRLSDLRMFFAKENYEKIRQGELHQDGRRRTSSGGGGTGSIGAAPITISALWTFDRDPSAPFAVPSGSAKVDNLDADKLDGYDWSGLGVDLVFSSSQTIRRNTSDGTDNGALVLTGGGAASQNRGSYLELYGNEHASTGQFRVFLGNVAGSAFIVDRADGNTTFTIDGATGLITLAHGQVKFPASQNASADVNTLDDYEEGTWTPVIGGAGGTSGQTYAAQVGRYVKVGKLVIAQGYVELSVEGTITGNAQIQGLPFTAENITNSISVTPLYAVSMQTTFASVLGRIEPNTTTAAILGVAAGGGDGHVALTAGNIDDNTGFGFCFCYRASN